MGRGYRHGTGRNDIAPPGSVLGSRSGIRYKVNAHGGLDRLTAKPPSKKERKRLRTLARKEAAHDAPR